MIMAIKIQAISKEKERWGEENRRERKKGLRVVSMKTKGTEDRWSRFHHILDIYVGWINASFRLSNRVGGEGERSGE
jgi:hypothetical protein